MPSTHFERKAMGGRKNPLCRYERPPANEVVPLTFFAIWQFALHIWVILQLDYCHLKKTDIFAPNLHWRVTPAMDICATLSFCLPQFWTSFLAAFCFQPLQWKYSFSDSQSASIREIHNLLDFFWISCYYLLFFCFFALFQNWIFSFSWILKNLFWVFSVFWPFFYSPTFSFYISASFFCLFLNCVCQGALLLSLFFLNCQHWFPLACCGPGHSRIICKFENCIFWESTLGWLHFDGGGRRWVELELIWKAGGTVASPSTKEIWCVHLFNTPSFALISFESISYQCS